MPELPEVETIKRDVQARIIGLSVTSLDVYLPKMVQGVTIEDLTRALIGSEIISTGRRGKVLLIGLSSGHTMLIHLKMSGQLLYLDPEDPLSKWTHVVFGLSNGNQLRFRDQRQFGYIRLARTEKLNESPGLSELGPEPLADDFTLKDLSEQLRKHKRIKIKSLLLDQAFIAGIGNIYADEILHMARINPLRPAASLKEGEIASLFNSVKTILTAAIENRGSSFSQFVDLAGEPGKYVHFHQVYRREGQGCLRGDGGVIKRVKISGRSTFFCPRCQR